VIHDSVSVTDDLRWRNNKRKNQEETDRTRISAKRKV